MPGNDTIHPIHDRWGRLQNFDFCSEVEPTETRPYMTWIDSGAQVLKVRTQDDSGWLTIGGSGGGGAPANAQYLVLALDGSLTAERRFVDGDGLQATDAGPNGDYTLAVKVSDFAGNGLEDDGANNLRIAAAAAGDGLQGGGGSALAVDSTVVRTSGNQTIAGVKTFENNLVLDDGGGDSPQLRFVSGSNDDVAYFYLVNDVNPNRSKLCLIIPPGGVTPGQEAWFAVYPQGGYMAFRVRSDGVVEVPQGQFIVDSPLVEPAGAFRVSGILEDGLAEVVAAYVAGGISGGDVGMTVRYSWYLYNDNEDDVLAAAIDAIWTDASVGSEDADLVFSSIIAGTLTEGFRLTGTDLDVVGDVHCQGDEAGLMKRVHNFLENPQEGFDGSDFEWLTTGWANGAIFDGTPDSLSFATVPSCVYVLDSVQNDFFYRYRSIDDPSGGNWSVFMRIVGIAGCDVAIRIDAGSDANENDFGELILSQTDGNPTMDIKYRHQENGGGVDSGTLLSTISIGPIILKINAGAANVIYVYYGYGDTPYTLVTPLGENLGDLDNWGSAASRIGISYKKTSPYGGRAATIDLFHTVNLTPS